MASAGLTDLNRLQSHPFPPALTGWLFISGVIMNNALTDNTIPTDTLCATPVKDEQRLRFWPQHFGRIPQWITLEPASLPGWTGCVITAVASGLFTLSATVAFMAPEESDGLVAVLPLMVTALK
jgi:hypothetical protein